MFLLVSLAAALIAGVAADGFGSHGGSHRSGRRQGGRRGGRSGFSRRGRTGDLEAAPLGGYGAGDDAGALSQVWVTPSALLSVDQYVLW